MSETVYYDSYIEKPQEAAALGRIVKWHTYTSMKTRLRRGYIGNALIAGGNRCICISGKSSSLSICAQMNIAGAAIAG